MFRELVETIIKSLVNDPASVEVKELEGSASIVLEIRVAEGDVGRIIGRNGRVINAIRTIMQSLAAKEDKRVTIEVL